MKADTWHLSKIEQIPLVCVSESKYLGEIPSIAQVTFLRCFPSLSKNKTQTDTQVTHLNGPFICIMKFPVTHM